MEKEATTKKPSGPIITVECAIRQWSPFAENLAKYHADKWDRPDLVDALTQAAVDGIRQAAATYRMDDAHLFPSWVIHRMELAIGEHLQSVS